MSSIYRPTIEVTDITKTSTLEQEGENAGFSCYKATVTVSFDIYAKSLEDAKEDAQHKMTHALS
jgi:hypothetical protein